MNLSDEERSRIGEEERVRADARVRAEAETKQRMEAEAAEAKKKAGEKTTKTCLGCLGVAVLICVVLAAIGALTGTSTNKSQKESGSTTGALTDALSDAAKAAIAKAFPNATLGKVMTDHGKDGEVSFVPMTDGDKKFEVCVSGAGLIIEVYSDIPVADLPKAIADALSATANGAPVPDHVTKFEWRAQDNKPLAKPRITYGTAILRGDTLVLVDVAEDGTVTVKKPGER